MRAALLLASLGLAGCGATLQQVQVPIPIECRVQTPTRPAMPTESLQAGVTVDAFVAAATAEIERREGYEGELRAALATCTAPIAK
jgi:hypothetical protein